MPMNCSSRHRMPRFIVLLMLAILLLSTAVIRRAPSAFAQTGVPGLLTCSDGSQVSLGQSCATGVSYCNGALVGPGQACSGPGVPFYGTCTTYPFCASVIMPANQGPTASTPSAGPNSPASAYLPPSVYPSSNLYPPPYTYAPAYTGSQAYTYSPLSAIYAPAWYGGAVKTSSWTGTSWRFCTVQGRGLVWLPAQTSVNGMLC